VKKKEVKKIVNSIQKTPLFQQAFTHVSLTNETQKKISNYETLEFLGDSILDMQACLYIYFNYPHYSEGQMSNLKKSMVREETLAKLSKELGFSSFLKLGTGEKKNQNQQKTSILADVFESFIAALYLEKGSAVVKKFLDLTLLEWIKGKEEFV
jgi:ribonuclease-3